MRSKRKSSNKKATRTPAKKSVEKKRAKWPPERKPKKSQTKDLIKGGLSKKSGKKASKRGGGILKGTQKRPSK